jgi:hypothetical protein
MATLISYKESIAIQAFLGYLNKNYSKQINPKDTYLIAAVAAWFHQESGGISRVIGNNPFNIRPGMTSFMSNGFRVSTRGNGKFLTFASMAKGFEAAAYLLMHGSKAYGYRVALNALKNGGNKAAVDFLAAMAMSSWDAANYGAHNWVEAYNPKKNHILRNYVGITGVQLGDPGPGNRNRTSDKQPLKKPKPPPPPPPKLPRDFNYKVTPRDYLDPWMAKHLYARRRRQKLDASGLKR